MDEIIADIYHAAAGTKPWSDPLTRIVKELGLRGSQMVGLATSSGAITYSHASEQVASEIELEYVRTYHTVDPRKELLLLRQAGHWLYDQDVFDDGMAESNACYREFIIPHGARHSATVKLLDHDGEVVILGFVSHLGLDGFSQRHRQTLQSVTFHLREAARIYQTTRKLATAAFAGTEMVQRMVHPAVLLATNRTVTFANSAAQRHMSDGCMFLCGDRLTALDQRTDALLASAFDAIDDELRQGSTPKRRIVPLFGAHKVRAAALSLTAFAPQDSMYAFGVKPQVLLVVHERAPKSEPDVALWEAAFDLTPAQSRVALGLFKGQTINQVADSLHIASTTAKTHLREVFQKTNTNRQAQLIASLAALDMA